MRTINAPNIVRSFAHRLLPICLASCAMSALAEHETHLRGIINVPEWQCALLEVNHSLANASAPPGFFTKTLRLKMGESFEDRTIKGAYVRFELLEINMERGQVKLRENGKETIYGFDTNSVPAVSSEHASSGKSGLRLQKVRFEDVMDMYAELKDRAVLFHPSVTQSPFSLQAVAQNKLDIIARLEKALLEIGIATVPDGESFVLVLPSSIKATITPPSTVLETTSTNRYSVAFSSTPLIVLIEEYGRMLGRTRVDGEWLPNAKTSLRANNLSDARLAHAYDTLLAWHGLKVVLVDDKTFKIVRLPVTGGQ